MEKEKLKFIDFYYCKETSKIEVMLDYYGFVAIVYLTFYSTSDSFKNDRSDSMSKLSWMTEKKWQTNYIKNLKSFRSFLTQIGIDEKLDMSSFENGLEERILRKIGSFVEVYKDKDSFKF